MSEKHTKAKGEEVDINRHLQLQRLKSIALTGIRGWWRLPRGTPQLASVIRAYKRVLEYVRCHKLDSKQA